MDQNYINQETVRKFKVVVTLNFLSYFVTHLNVTKLNKQQLNSKQISKNTLE